MPADPVLLQFGKRLREIRKRENLSQEELADLAGIHRNTVGTIERKGMNLNLLTISRLARALHVKVSDLVH